MAVLDITTLKANIDADITTNGNEEITGAQLNTILKDIVDSYANKADEQHLLGLTNYDPTKQYNANGEGATTVEGGLIYQANTTPIGPEAFDPANWDLIGGTGWLRVTKTHIDFQAAATTNDIEIYELPSKFALEAVAVKHTVVFSGGGITDYDLTIGITGELDKFLFDPFDLTQAVGGSGHNSVTGLFIEDSAASTSIRAAVTSAGADLDQSTTGSVEIALLVSQVFS